MTEEDISKTAFVCPGFVCLFEWVVMTFGLKNAGATYQRMVDKVFIKQLGRNMEAYIDDMMVKSMSMTCHINDL